MDRMDGYDDYYPSASEVERRRLEKIRQDRDKEIDDLLKKDKLKDE